MSTDSKKYYYGSEVYGRIYDWNKIFKLYESLGIPSSCWKVKKESLKSKYSVILSGRSIGKTTNVLLLGLCQRKLYSTTICYVRSQETEFTPTEAKHLTSVISSYEDGAYIKKLTDNRYNTIVYKARAFYYAWSDENGVITDKEANECIRVLTVDRAYDYKSTLNMPKGDFMIFDEFVGKRYNTDEFVYFCDLIKTVFRDRLSPVIFMTANTISTTSPYYSELEIKKYLRAMKSGEHMSVETEAGTKIYIELAALPTKAKEKRAFFNAAFLGFKNDKLGAITGGQLWALPRVPHTYRREPEDIPTYHHRNIYLKNDGEMLRCDIVSDNKTGLHLEIFPGSEPKDDAIILTTDIPSDKRELYCLGGRRRKLRKIITTLIEDGKVFFATNEDGAIFKNFMMRALEIEKNPLI